MGFSISVKASPWFSTATTTWFSTHKMSRSRDFSLWLRSIVSFAFRLVKFLKPFRSQIFTVESLEALAKYNASFEADRDVTAELFSFRQQIRRPSGRN